MIYLKLFLGFLKVGCFAFGGAYGAIPLVRDVVLSNGWMGEETLSYMIAVSESTPGPIMVNMATYVGGTQAGFLGALLATLAVVLPSFVVILIVMALLNHVLQNKYTQAVLRGLKPCVIGVILATGAFMMIENCFLVSDNAWNPDLKNILMTALLAAVLIGYKLIKKKKLSSIPLIVVSAVLGIAVYGF